MLESMPRLRTALNFMAHPVLYPVSRLETYSRAAYNFSTRIRLDGWTGEHRMGDKLVQTDVPLRNLSAYRLSQIRLAAAQLLLEKDAASLPAKGPIRLTVHGSFQEYRFSDK